VVIGGSLMVGAQRGRGRVIIVRELLRFHST
jgi:hypothetical protein